MTEHACPHSRLLHRHGGRGRCTVAACSCVQGPGPAAPRVVAEPPQSATVTVDGSSTVVAFRPPERPSQRRKLENLLWHRMADAGLPEPVKEYRFAESIGRQFRSDGFLAPDLLIEVDGGVWMPGGGGHSHPMHLETQHHRDNLAVILGFRVLRFTEKMIRDGTAVDHIRRALEPVERAIERVLL